jgi:hypothetical protein
MTPTEQIITDYLLSRTHEKLIPTPAQLADEIGVPTDIGTDAKTHLAFIYCKQT